MRIAVQLWLGFVLAIVVVLGLGVTIRVREERAHLLELTLRDRRFFAHALRVSLSREHGTADPVREARALLGQEAIAEAHIDARLVSPDGAHGLPPPLLSGAAARAVRAGEVYVALHGDEVVTLVPVDPAGVVALELREAQAVSAALSHFGARSLVRQSLALGLLAGLSTLLLVRGLVGAPLGALAALSRRIAAGELDARAVERGGDDEVAVLGREMNAMAARLQRARRALDESEAERVGALEKLRHEDRLRTAGQLSSTLAHELGTPLNLVTGHARIIDDDPEVSESTRASARTILEQGARMTRILRDVLDFTRRRPPSLAPRSLLDLARDAVRMLSPLSRRQAVEIEVEGRPTQVVADGQQLLQVITNLLMNAMQATQGAGRVKLRVDEVEATPPEGVHAPPGTYARLQVSDAGCGIAPEDLAHLFEPYFTRRAEGTGLGLAVVADIVRDHRGWIVVHSTPGEGSHFDVYLPRQA